MTFKNWLFKQVRRLGGSYGGKSFCSQLYGAATAIAAHKVNKPVRLVLDLKTNMEMFGKRFPYMGKYKVKNGLLLKPQNTNDFFVNLSNNVITITVYNKFPSKSTVAFNSIKR